MRIQATTIPPRPWEKLGIDFIGPINKLGFRDRFLLVLVDYHSKWFVVETMGEINTNVITFLERIFLDEGMPSLKFPTMGYNLYPKK